MAKISAGILMFRVQTDGLEVLLVHPGGPLWSAKDMGAWTIPKGEATSDEPLFATARREFQEETGFVAEGTFIPLGKVRQAGGKIVHAWALEGDCDAAAIQCNQFSMIWPPKSGKIQSFPEVDRAQWFSLSEAHQRILQSQSPFLDRLAVAVRDG